jgi:hopanoid biosynthesis associated RND transporter like protein HpnN
MNPRRLAARAVAAAAQACGRHPVATVVVSSLLAVAGGLYSLYALAFVTSHVRLLPQYERYVTLLREYQRDFGELNDIVVAVEAPNPGRAKDFAERLAADLGRAGVDASRITYRIDPAYFERRGLLYLSVDELTKLRDRLFDSEEFVESYAANPILPRLLEGINQQIANAMVLGFFDLGLGGGKATDLRFLDAVIDQIAARLDGRAGYTSPWATAFSVGRLDEPDAGYYFSSDKRWLFMFVRQARHEGSFAETRATTTTIRRTIAGLAREFPDVSAGVTGSRAISNDEMITAFGDSQFASALSFVFTLGLLILTFRLVVKPALMTATLTASLFWSTGLVTLVVGHLSIFSVMFISIVVGIGIDYGVYFLFGYREERGLGASPVAALHRAGERMGPGIVLGGLTAAGAFVVLMLTDFQGIREFGLVSALSILVACVSMVTLFPALLVLAERWARPGSAAPAMEAVAPARWLEALIRPRRTILVGALVLTAFATWGALQVDFAYNMLKLQAKGVESVLWEERIVAKAGRSGFAALASAADLGELRRKQDAFAALPSVSKVDSVLMLLPDRQAEKMTLIEQFAPVVASVQVAPLPAPAPVDLRPPLRTLQRRLGLALEEAGDEARSEVQPVKAKIEGLLVRLDAGAGAAAGLEDLQARLARDFADRLASFQKSLSPRPVSPGEAPPELERRYIGASGRYLLRIHPAVDIWQREGAERFVTELRTVDPDVTGPPVTSYEAIGFIRSGYFYGTLYALVLVTLVTAAMLRSATGTLLALTPLGLAALWTVGFMHVFDLEFNLANVWALPLIIGTAAEFGINIFMQYQEGLATGGPTFPRSTVMGVLLNGLTTVAGFASLMVAHHRGIFGLGLLLTIGVTASMITALIVLPALLQLFYGRHRPDAAYVRADVSGDTAVSR